MSACQSVLYYRPPVAQDPYHFSIIKTHLNRQLDALFPSFDNEISRALSESIHVIDTSRQKNQLLHSTNNRHPQSGIV